MSTKTPHLLVKPNPIKALLLSRKVRHGAHPVLTMCAANAVTTSDPAGNRKLDKQKATGRIDGMVALAMAVGVMPNEPESSGVSWWEVEA